ncbi:MAG: DUF4010 domain-containing protein [Candidatus Lokiarchaeota archaeon]|nr:DUF4010 domain-containing protein [Candidatus Lokiarchaeota archaeon]
MMDPNFIEFLIPILVSLFCGFIIGIERTRVSAQYGARDHIFFSIISTTIIILYDKFLQDLGFYILIIIFGGMIVFLLIGTFYRLFRTDDPGYTTTLSMLLAMVVGIVSYYNSFLAITISVIFLIILSTKKQFYKIQTLKDIEWTGTVEFLAIMILTLILFPQDLIIYDIQIVTIVYVFLTILAIKYFSYFLLKSSSEENLYILSILGGFAHSEATTKELAEIDAHPATVSLLLQTMIIRILLVIILISFELTVRLFYPLILTTIIGIIINILILRKKEKKHILQKVKNPLSLKSALIFSSTYLFAVFLTIIFKNIQIPYQLYLPIAIMIGLLSGGASSLFTATAYISGLIDLNLAIIMIVFGLCAAILNKLLYYYRFQKTKSKKNLINLIIYISLTMIVLLFFSFTIGFL